ncbi:hypothetical protein BZA77DRAFT_322607 [Pyronema omphalodes]|nr:hypothetical protein BZA77DRAFT_322607 [Pyronema omphalodes]
MAPTPTTIPTNPWEPPFTTNPPIPYDPAPSRNAFLTVIAVFAFFGTCFTIVAAWIHCVATLEARYYDSPNDQQQRMRRREGHQKRLQGFQEWYRRRSTTIAKRQFETKIWHHRQFSSVGERTPLISDQPNDVPIICGSSSRRGIPRMLNGTSGNGLGSGNLASVNGNGNHKMWYYSNEHPLRPERNQRRIDRDHKTISPKSSRLSNLANSPHSSSPSKLAGSPSRRAWTPPSPSNNTSRVYKNARPRVYGRIPPRRKSTGGSAPQRPLLRTATGFTYPRGLEVVFEEGGSTPER